MPKRLPNYKEFDLDSSLRPFSKIRLVVLDLDGTLLESDESELPQKVLELAKKLRHYKTNVRLTIATGRTLTGARPLLDRLPILNDTPIILYNGSVILNRKYEVLNIKTIPNASLQRIIEVSSRFHVKVIAYACSWFGDSGPEESALGWSSLDRPERDYNKMSVEWLDWDKVDSAFTPSAVVIHMPGQDKTISDMTVELGMINDISYSHGGTFYIEVRPKDSNKGVALDFAASRLKLSRHEVLAIGDNDNDAEMLSWAGIGVAVNSASSLAARSSNYRAKRGVIEGAIEVLKLVHSARRLLGQ
ncbi:MAG TPA: HAD family hydrolase [Desulfatiglandales bacterium]|nr:HAD family hydrolase [Desulfatiglandales bacterium]